MTNRPRVPTPNESILLRKWQISSFWVMLIGYIGYYLCRGNLSVALPLMSSEFGYSNTDLAKILTFSEVAYAIGKFTTGPFADRLSGKKIFLIGMLGAVLFNFVFVLHSSLLFFTIIWCIVRYFLSMGWGGIIKTIGEWYEPEKNGTVMGLISINFQFGSVIASLFCGILISYGWGWKALFVFPAIVVGFMAVISYFASKDSPQVVIPGVIFGKNAGRKKSIAQYSQVGALSILKTLFKIRLFQQVLVFSFLAHILRSFFMFWIPKFLVDIGMKSVNAAFSSAIFPLVGCIGTILLGWYTDRYSKNGNRAAAMWKMLIGLTLCLVCIAVLVPYQLQYQGLILILLGLSGFFLYGPYSMSAGCMSLDIAGPEGAGTCTGMIDGVGYLGGAVAAWGTGVLADKLGWSEVFWVLAVCSLFSVGWTLRMSLTSRSSVSA